jgi:hypothetical protein
MPNLFVLRLVRDDTLPGFSPKIEFLVRWHISLAPVRLMFMGCGPVGPDHLGLLFIFPQKEAGLDNAAFACDRPFT